MTELSQLLFDCHSAGVILQTIAPNELKIDAPRKSLTPVLLERLKTHKHAIIQALKQAPHKVEADEEWPETIDIRKVTPCPNCGTLELWESMADKWRCLDCDPPIRWRTFMANQRTFEPNSTS